MHTKTRPSLQACLILQIFVSISMALETKFRLTEIFRDDFNTDDYLNASKWTAADRHTASPLELSYYKTEFARVQNEYLALHCKQQPYAGCNYTSSRVDTNGKFTFLYGEIEWRAKMPGGPDFYTGLWLANPTSQRVSLPLEFLPPAVAFLDRAGVLSQRLFFGYNHLDQVNYDLGLHGNIFLQKKALAFHALKIVWTNESLEWFIDGDLVYWVRDAAKIPQVPLQIVMNIVVGGVFCSVQVDGTSLFQPRHMLIDYVVVRQNISYVTEEERQLLTPSEKTAIMPGYFIPVAGTLAVMLVVCVAVLAVFILRLSRQRYPVRNSGELF